MPRPPAPVHYLRRNHKEWAPPSCIFLDTETRTVPGTEPEVLALRLWAARFTDRRTPRGVAPREQSGQGHTATELAQWITTATRNRDAVWLFCHNLAFDLTTTRLPLVLVRAGWVINDAAVGGKAPWVTMGRGKRVLTIVDSWSWLPRPLADIGEQIGMAKPVLPPDDGTDAAWFARCWADVDIMAAAMLDLMAWWDRSKLGRWAISGPSCGWNAYRHTDTPVQVLVDPDPEKVAQDRLAVHGGRRGTWTVGDHAAGPFAELDFTAAYPTVAAHLPLPIARVRQFASLPVDDQLVDGGRWGIVARVRIATDVPRWPVRDKSGTWYPVGEFWADLAGPDIAEARRLGCLREIGPGWVHRLGQSMAPWAQWVLRVMDGTEPGTPAAARIAAKTWSRSVLGKWAARAYERTKLGPAPTSGWGYEQGYDHAAGCEGGMVDLAGQRWWVAASGTPDNAYPAILAWVEAEVRVRLGRVIEALGPAALLQCDTDGLIVAERAVGTVAAHGHLVAPQSVPAHGRLTWCLDQIEPVTAPLSLRVKRRLSHVVVLGPQHLVRDGERRFAGLPGTATPMPDGRYQVRQWPGLQWQMTHGRAAGYVRPQVAVSVTGPWPTGWVLHDGQVVAPQAQVRPDGSTRILGWNSSDYPRNGLALAEHQNPALDRLL